MADADTNKNTDVEKPKRKSQRFVIALLIVMAVLITLAFMYGKKVLNI